MGQPTPGGVTRRLAFSKSIASAKTYQTAGVIMSQPLTDVISVKPLTGYRLFIVFEDGVAGEVDLGQLIKFEGIFAALKRANVFCNRQSKR